jgi:hypothetical protein
VHVWLVTQSFFRLPQLVKFRQRQKLRIPC